jgi:hypothetical protein
MQKDKRRKPKSARFDTTLCVSVTKEMLKCLRSKADEHDMSVCQVIRTSIRKMMEEQKNMLT